MFMRKVLQISRRLPERFLWRVPCAAYCNKQSDKQGDAVGKCPFKARRLKEAEDYLANLDEDGLKKMEEIKLLMQTLRLENKQVPDEIPLTQWKRLITEHLTYYSRSKYLRKLFLDEAKQRNTVLKKREKAKIREEVMKSHQNPPEVSVHRPARDKEVKLWNGMKTVKSDINVVFDLDFEQTTREEVATFNQIQMVWSNNLKHLQPLNIHLTSINRNSRLKEQFLQESNSVFVHTHEESFADIFPHEDLVFLSPEGRPMEQFDPTCTYIIGGIVDIQRKNRMTFGKAKKLGIRTASFPIKEYCDLSVRSPGVGLTLTSVYGIIQDMYLHHSWRSAFQNNLRSCFHLYDDGVLSNEKSIDVGKRRIMAFKRSWN